MMPALKLSPAPMVESGMMSGTENELVALLENSLTLSPPAV
jgi:hypothetical protein